jgi:DNA-binding transcriptional ArsR family regulator
MTPYVIVMTATHDYSNILKHKEDQAEKNRQTVLDTVRQLTRLDHEDDDYLPSFFFQEKTQKDKPEYVSSSEITKYLDGKTTELNQQIKLEIQERYQNGEFPKNEIQYHINSQCKKSMNLRTVQRWLSKLKEEGLLEYKDNKYSLSKKAISDVRYFAAQIGWSALAGLMNQRTNLFNTVEKNVKELITFLGFYTLLCLNEAARPIRHSPFSTLRPNLSIYQKDKLALSWARTVIDPFSLYFYFLDTFKNQPADNVAKKIRKVKFKELRDDKYIYVDNKGEEYDHLVGINESLVRYIDGEGKEYISKIDSVGYPITESHYRDLKVPFYELDEKTYTAINRVLKRRFRKLYRSVSRPFAINTKY